MRAGIDDDDDTVLTRSPNSNIDETRERERMIMAILIPLSACNAIKGLNT